jgi:hypothetical protein
MITSHPRIRDHRLADLINELDDAVELLDGIPLSDGLEFNEWHDLRTALTRAADRLSELRVRDGGAP